jgi:glycerol-3-phosphate dehydrogenase subunit B
MMFDAIVIGAELDGWLCALRLLEKGRSVCVLSHGAGSLHYAPGGVRVLGRTADRDGPVAHPLECIDALHERHPYRRAGLDRCRAALTWFGGVAAKGLSPDSPNHPTVSSGGLNTPVLHACPNQAMLEDLVGRKVTLLAFRGHRDFTAGLIVSELTKAGVDVVALEVDAPGNRTDTVAISRLFDGMNDDSAWFDALSEVIPDATEIILCAAAMGFDRHAEVLGQAGKSWSRPVHEVPTLPACVPGMRMARSLEAAVRSKGGVVRTGIKVIDQIRNPDGLVSVLDENGRSMAARSFVLATGGVLMGGLDVQSDGAVRESALGLDVASMNPLAAEGREATLAALHTCGVETDDNFRADGNVFVTGRTLAHWNPAVELSAEGVSIVSGWSAAEAIHEMLGD